MLGFGNFTMLGVRLAIEMAISVLMGMAVREWVRAWTAAAFHDPTPRLWGRVTLNPRAWFDPFGSGLVPGLIFLLWTVQFTVMPVAYAKPAPVDPSYFRNRAKDLVKVSLAGPGASLALGSAAGLLARIPFPLEVVRFLTVLSLTNFGLAVFHLLPIPGLDGGRLVALILPPRSAEVFRNADQYLPLIVLVLVFVLGTLFMGFVYLFGGALCGAASGRDCASFIRI